MIYALNTTPGIFEMSLRLASFAFVLLTWAMPATAETWSEGGARHHSHTWRSDARGQPRPRRTNGRDDCGNGDCRGVNSPGIMGGAPGDF